MYNHVQVPEAAHFPFGKVTALGVLCCFALFVCVALLASFFLLINMYIHCTMYTAVFSVVSYVHTVGISIRYYLYILGFINISVCSGG